MNDKNLRSRDICGLIITYNGIESIAKTINLTMKILDKIIIVDNFSTDGTIEYLQSIKNENIIIIFLDKNYGIAKALNTGFKKAIEMEYLWVLTLDQDSYLTEKDLDKLIEVYRGNIEVMIGIICPKIIYSESKRLKSRKELVYLKSTITSGNIVNVDAYIRVSGFEEKLFIDNVDFDFCLKLINEEYKIIRNNNAFLVHRLGELRYIRILKFGFKIHVHNLDRKYYMSRNHIYLTKRYIYSQPLLIFKLNFFYLLFLIQVAVFENNKKASFKSIINGLRDGVLNNFDVK